MPVADGAAELAADTDADRDTAVVTRLCDDADTGVCGAGERGWRDEPVAAGGAARECAGIGPRAPLPSPRTRAFDAGEPDCERADAVPDVAAGRSGESNEPVLIGERAFSTGLLRRDGVRVAGAAGG